MAEVARMGLVDGGGGGASREEAGRGEAGGALPAPCAPCEADAEAGGEGGADGGGMGGGGSGEALAAGRFGGYAPEARRRLGCALGRSEWDADEVAEVTARLRQIAPGEVATLPASSARKRRLVHFAADGLGLHHATTGKAVAVTRRA